MLFSVIIHNELVSCLHCILLWVVVFLNKGVGWRRSPGAPCILVVCLSECALATVSPSGRREGGTRLPQGSMPRACPAALYTTDLFGFETFPKI